MSNGARKNRALLASPEYVRACRLADYRVKGWGNYPILSRKAHPHYPKSHYTVITIENSKLKEYPIKKEEYVSGWAGDGFDNDNITLEKLMANAELLGALREHNVGVDVPIVVLDSPCGVTTMFLSLGLGIGPDMIRLPNPDPEMQTKMGGIADRCTLYSGTVFEYIRDGPGEPSHWWLDYCGKFSEKTKLDTKLLLARRMVPVVGGVLAYTFSLRGEKWGTVPGKVASFLAREGEKNGGFAFEELRPPRVYNRILFLVFVTVAPDHKRHE